ncbi:MAG: hypothetical protein A3A86_05530 [Elusimicrobia bacterium RIFCSPLOWO2_01_FULL_60_11]|nr:MAG: hypothetical protein A3A86_05530 [Elusimicrobia bacterium RIFCSPLOWO2_01_FULL_60_11]
MSAKWNRPEENWMARFSSTEREIHRSRSCTPVIWFNTCHCQSFHWGRFKKGWEGREMKASFMSVGLP